MNSLNNSQEFNVCFDEDLSVENSIIFEENPLKNHEISHKISLKNMRKIPKKSKKTLRKKPNFYEEKNQRFATIPSVSLPNLLFRRDLMINLKPKKTRNLYLRISKNGSFCKAKISLIYPSKYKGKAQKNVEKPEKLEISSEIIKEICEKTDKITDKNEKIIDKNEKIPEKNTDKIDKNEKKLKKSLINPSLSTIKHKTSQIKPNSDNLSIETGEIKVNAVPLTIVNNPLINNNAENKELLILAETSNIRWCQLCNLILSDDLSNLDHLSTKAHKKFKSLYGFY